MSFVIGVVIIVIMVFLLKNTIIIDAIEARSMNLHFFMTDLFHPPEEISEGAYRINTAKGIRNDVVIFGFDEKSLSDLGRYPWDRSVYARFLENANDENEFRPEGVLLDVLFTERSNPSEDEALERAFQRFGDNTIIDLYADFSTQVPTVSSETGERVEMITNRGIPASDQARQIVNVVNPPLKNFIRTGVIIAPATSFPGLNQRLASQGADRVVRRFALVVKINGRYYPSTVLWLAMLHYGVTLQDVDIQIGEKVVLRNAAVETARGVVQRDITIPIDQQGTLLVNFYGSQGTFQIKSFSDVVKGSVDQRYFRDKLVLTGVYAEGLQDIHETPYGPMFGIEMMVNVVTQILNQDFIRFTSENSTLLIIAFFGLFISYIVGRKSIFYSSVSVLVLAVVYFFAVIILFDNFRYVLNLSAPLIPGGLTLFSMVVYRVLTEEKEKRAIQRMFSNYVSKSVVDELIKDPKKLELGGEEKEITVLFSDIRGFTTLSEKLSPQELVSHLNEYLSAMTDIILKYRGTLDKYVGDEIMAFWNAPVEQDNHVELACKTALEMMQKLHELNRSWPNEKKLNIGIGLNTGIMVVGNMGSRNRMDYTLMGDNVNLGARLEGTNKFYRTNVIVSEFTHDLIRDSFVFRELDIIRVKGKQKPVKIYELMDTVDSGSSHSV
jgi:class 3 adenylate cyclase/CHASE2 domain-containing sensor protein